MPHKLLTAPLKKRRMFQRRKIDMRAHYGFEIVESCLTGPVREDRLFCDLAPAALKGLEAISSSASYPKGATLFLEGQKPRGVFVLCIGRAKLSTNSADGKSLILRIAEAGEIIGLPGTLSNRAYEATAEVLEPIQANFIRRDAFLRFLRERGDAALQVAQIMSEIYNATYQEVRYLGLSGSAAGKLAHFLLDWMAAHGKKNASHVPLNLTHTQIGEMIGLSRETVTRFLADFKRKKWIAVNGSLLSLTNKRELQRLVAG